jgi:phage shock protein A
MLKRIGNLLKGALGMTVSGVERRNPEMLLEVEKENLRTQIGKFNKGLAAHAGLCERLMARVKTLETQQLDLQARTRAHLNAGNRDIAAQYALQLKNTVQELDDNRRQLAAAEETYSTLIRQRDAAVEAAKRQLDAMKKSIDDLKVKKAMAELTEAASGMITGSGGSGDTLARLREMVEEERSKAAGRIRVARDSMSLTDLDMKEREQKALAEQALTEFENNAAHPPQLNPGEDKPAE